MHLAALLAAVALAAPAPTTDRIRVIGAPTSATLRTGSSS